VRPRLAAGNEAVFGFSADTNAGGWTTFKLLILVPRAGSTLARRKQLSNSAIPFEIPENGFGYEGARDAQLGCHSMYASQWIQQLPSQRIPEVASPIEQTWVHATVLIETGAGSRGTGFFVGRSTGTDQWRIFLVTNKHVIDPDPARRDAISGTLMQLATKQHPLVLRINPAAQLASPGHHLLLALGPGGGIFRATISKPPIESVQWRSPGRRFQQEPHSPGVTACAPAIVAAVTSLIPPKRGASREWRKSVSCAPRVARPSRPAKK
jgi:hypothetical protein